MPVYRKGAAWRVVVFVEGVRKDAIVRCSREEAEAIERTLHETAIEEAKVPGWKKAALRARPSPFAETFIYFLQAGVGGPIKIGRATDLQSRIDGIQTGNHEKLTLLVAVTGQRMSETDIHALFDHLRIHGEWFRPEADLLAFIEEVKARP